MAKKNIVVAGCSKGIGKCIFEHLNCSEYQPIGISRSKLLLDNTFSGDLSNPHDIENLGRIIESGYSCLNGLIYVAGITGIHQNSKPLKTSIQNIREFTTILDTNLLAAYRLIYRLNDMFSDNASIIFISSIGSKQAFSQNPGYQVSKAGLEALSRSIAYDFRHRSIRSNTIRMGYFKTDMTIDSYENQQAQIARTNRTLLDRWGEPDDIIGSVLFLLSDQSSYITASVITIDGGWLAKGI
mgnify:CR=1 FL=1